MNHFVNFDAKHTFYLDKTIPLEVFILKTSSNYYGVRKFGVGWICSLWIIYDKQRLFLLGLLNVMRSQVTLPR